MRDKSNEDITIEWSQNIHGDISGFRITSGEALYVLPWYRRILMRLIGRSHFRKWHHFEIKRG